MFEEEGFLISETGVLIRRNLEPDTYNRDSAPLYVYNRSVRFRELCNQHVDYESIRAIMRIFVAMEDLWQRDIKRYSDTRKYFLSQKLLLKQIALYIGVKCSIKRPIHDRRRLATQMEIFQKLLKDFLFDNKCQHKCISESSLNNTTSGRLPNYPYPAGKLPVTQSEIQDLLMILKVQCPSSLGWIIQHTCYVAVWWGCPSARSSPHFHRNRWVEDKSHESP